MGSIINFVTNPLKIFDYGDPRVANYFLMGSPLPFMLLLVGYTSFVLKIGPLIMKNRAPLKIDGLVMVYNIIQILLNGIMLVMALPILPKLSIFCTPLDNTNDPTNVTLNNLHYCYTLLKILDFLDTIFFTLRKKFNQVTFLHVYHHIMMATFAWVLCKFFVGGHVYFMGLPNVFVHVVMYFYYFLTSWNPVYKKSIWWKKHITQLQITQHCFICIAFLLPLLNKDCSYPKPLLVLYISQAVLMIVLFTDFYIKTYIKRKENTK